MVQMIESLSTYYGIRVKIADLKDWIKYIDSSQRKAVTDFVNAEDKDRLFGDFVSNNGAYSDSAPTGLLVVTLSHVNYDFNKPVDQQTVYVGVYVDSFILNIYENDDEAPSFDFDQAVDAKQKWLELTKDIDLKGQKPKFWLITPNCHCCT